MEEQSLKGEAAKEQKSIEKEPKWQLFGQFGLVDKFEQFEMFELFEKSKSRLCLFSLPVDHVPGCHRAVEDCCWSEVSDQGPCCSSDCCRADAKLPCSLVCHSGSDSELEAQDKYYLGPHNYFRRNRVARTA